MVDAPGAEPGSREPSVPEIRPLDQYDFSRAKICASVRWLLSKSYGSAENVSEELREPLYKDQYEQEHLKPSVCKLLLSPNTYCRVQSRLLHPCEDSSSKSTRMLGDNSALLQFLVKAGCGPKVQDTDVSEEDLRVVPIKTKAHLAMIDALMTLAAKETVARVKMAAEAEQMGVGTPWENALLFWVNRLNQKLREITEEEEPAKVPTGTDVQPAQDAHQSTRWYWKLVPHAIAFCLKESGNKPPVIRYRKDKVRSKLTPTFPLVYSVKDLSNGCAIASVLHYYCSGMLALEDVCLKDTMSLADSLYNLQLIKEFCESSLHNCCPLAVEDLLYAPPLLHLNIMSFVGELLDWFEVKRPDFVKPVQAVDLTDISGLLDCTSPVSANGKSGAPPPAFILKPPLVSPENMGWTTKQISRPLSAVTFSIPFGLDSDVDIVMGNPIDSVFRSASTDSLTTGIPAMTSPVTSAGVDHLPHSSEDFSLLVSSSAPSQCSSWGNYGHKTPIGELPTIEEALQVVHTHGNRDPTVGKITVKGGKGGRPEPRLRPEGAPAGFFLHSPEEENQQLSSSAPCRSGSLYRPAGDEAVDTKRQGRGEWRERAGGTTDMSRDDDSVLRDGSVDSSEMSDDAPRNAPGNIRPNKGHRGKHAADNSRRMTSFAECRDNRKRHPAAAGEELASASPLGTPLMPTNPVVGAYSHQNSPDSRSPEPGYEAWELGVRLEEKRKSIEAQKRRIEAIFAKHRQRLGKTAFLQLKREQGEGSGEAAAAEDSVTLEERLTRMEEQLKEEERDEKEGKKGEEKEKEKPSVPNPARLEKQVTFAIESKKGGEIKKEGEVEKGGEVALVEYNEVVLKLSEALQSLQREMQKLTEQQQQLMGNQKPRTAPAPKGAAKTQAKTPPRTPTKTPPRTPTKTPMRASSKAWIIPTALDSSPSRRSQVLASPKTSVSSSCPAPRTKIHSSSASRSPKHHPRPNNPPHLRPCELKFPPLTRVLTPTQNVDTLPHLRRVSPSKCQVQTSSSFRIGGPPTPQEPTAVAPLPQQTDECVSDTGSSETPTQFSLELELEQEEAVGLPPLLPMGGLDRQSSSGAPSECSFESEAFTLSAAYGGDTAVEKPCGSDEVSPSSTGEEGSEGPIDEGQEFSSDSMSDRTESAAEPARGPPAETLDPLEQLEMAMRAPEAPSRQSQLKEQAEEKETGEQNGEQNQQEKKGGIQIVFTEEVQSEEEMARRRALLLEKQQKRTEELKKRRQWHEQERESRPASSDKRVSSPSNTPPAGAASPSPTPPATPARRGDFVRREYARRQQLRLMDDLEKVLQQKTGRQGGSSAKKAHSRPRSMTREETPKLSLSPAKGSAASRLNKVYSHSSLNLAATDEPGSNGANPTKKPHSRQDLPGGCTTTNGPENQNGEKELNTASSVPEYTGPKLFKEPSFKSNKFIIHNALSRCCLAGKVNETQKNKIVEEMEKSPANHFLILFRDSSCQFRGVYTMNPESQELVRLAGVGPRTISSTQVESIYKYSSDRKQFSTIPSKTMGMSVDAFTIPGHVWQGGPAGPAAGPSRRASITKKAVVSK